VVVVVVNNKEPLSLNVSVCQMAYMVTPIRDKWYKLASALML